MLLTLAVIATKTDSEPVPIPLNVSSWNPRYDDLLDWVGKRIIETYPFLDNKKAYGEMVAQRLISTNRIAIVIDGIDEVGDELRPLAIAKISDALPSNVPLVIACRDDEYHALPAGRLHMEVIHLEPLSPQEIVSFLYQGERLAVDPYDNEAIPDDSGRWRALFGKILEGGEGALVRVLSIPLYASLARSVFSDEESSPGLLVSGYPSDANGSDLKRILIDQFLIKSFRDRSFTSDRLTRNGRQVDRVARRIRWLSALAESVPRDSPILWWRCHTLIGQRAWAILAGIVTGAFYLLTIEYPEGLKRGIALGMALGLLVGLTRGALGGAIAAVYAAVTALIAIVVPTGLLLGWEVGLWDGGELGVAIGVAVWILPRLTSVKRVMVGSLKTGLATAPVTAMHDTLYHGLAAGIVRGTTTIFGIGMCVAFSGILTVILKVGEPPSQPTPMQATRIRRDQPILPYLFIGIASGLFIGLGGGLIGAVRFSLSEGWEVGLSYGAALGASYGLTAGLAVGITGAIVKWMSEPTNVMSASTPLSTLRTGRVTALVYIFFGLGSGLLGMAALQDVTSSILTAPSLLQSPGRIMLLNGASLGLCIGLILATCFTPWPTLVVVRLALAISRTGPLRLMNFLEDAHRVEALRQDGAAYYFRHAEIHDRLASEAGSPHGL